ILFNHFPKTFGDAIKITKALGADYLWIDSLCIVQDSAGDWDHESQKMEKVFISANCVLDASAVKSSHDGLFIPRQRDYIWIAPKNVEPFYLYETIEDYDRDVSHAPLNSRAWALQERALAHRTIHFAERQIYWECGQVVRCESLAKMHSTQASFLANPKFPELAAGSSLNQRIKVFQDLYSKCSRMQLSFAEDRPIAIVGLENRLLHSFERIGGFGVFNSFFHQSLLWRRGEDEICLKRIEGRSIPTWSWMAHTGGIDYIQAPFMGVDWNVSRSKLRSPWNRTDGNFWNNEDD
ncbi:hypothetical protein CC78DRAFT_593772, partial [Lojkania enalia]